VHVQDAQRGQKSEIVLVDFCEMHTQSLFEASFDAVREVIAGPAAACNLARLACMNYAIAPLPPLM
jgi:hypothetical protein